MDAAADGSSESSSITKAASNSAGSGPRGGGPSPSFGLDLLGCVEGDSVRVEGRLVELDLDTGAVPADFWRACSSAMRESIAPLSR
jgi:hypothetical protein